MTQDSMATILLWRAMTTSRHHGDSCTFHLVRRIQAYLSLQCRPRLIRVTLFPRQASRSYATLHTLFPLHGRLER